MRGRMIYAARPRLAHRHQPIFTWALRRIRGIDDALVLVRQGLTTFVTIQQKLLKHFASWTVFNTWSYDHCTTRRPRVQAGPAAMLNRKS